MMIFWYVGSIVSGSILGIAFFHLYRVLVPYGLSSRYWTLMGRNVISLLKDDISEFWKIYRHVIQSSIGYVVRQILGILLAILPALILMLTAGPWLQSSWNEKATLVVYPDGAGKLIENANTFTLKDDKLSKSAIAGDRSPNYTVILSSGYHQKLDDPSSSYIICTDSSLTGWLMTTFGFIRILVDPELIDGRSYVIVRSFHDDLNPLWPYLSDPEFLFFISFSLLVVVLMLRKKEDAHLNESTGYDMSLVDYILTSIATRYARTMRAIGNWETGLSEKKLSAIKIKNPIFITGLARAGTTILLETLSNINSIATHRYRDFPFIMTPIYWNRFISLFAAKQESVERPHKDRIKINRESPDAFEEPIWQHFFPFIHDPKSIHKLDSSSENSAFEKFYREHIKKILLIRKGTRYLSKGNYNFTRIEYISNIFPDARFLIPIRHPLHHIASLVQQHKLFEDYTHQNQHIPEYLEAVGHYEFGPQRRPICLSENTGNRILSAWGDGDDYLGYAIQWSEIYRFLADLFRNRSELKKNIYIIRYEDLCNDACGQISRLLDFLKLDEHTSRICALQKISPSSRTLKMSQGQIDSCWENVKDIATIYGYRKMPDDAHRPFNISSLIKQMES